MEPRATRVVVPVVFLFFFLAASSLQAQQTATLSGTVTGSLGSAVPKARISAKNAATGATAEVESDAAGNFVFSNLVPGDYDISVTADGYATKNARVSIIANATQKQDFALQSGASSGPSLSELGFPNSATQGSARDQALLDKRSHMLKIHQRLGLITTIPLVATVFSGSFAGGRSTSTTARDLHAALGGTTAVLYFTTASYAIFAPKLPDTPTRGPIKLHKALAWIHGPGMVLTPILGALAFEQKSRGERVHGIASAHAPVAYTTAIAYGAAILSVSLKF